MTSQARTLLAARLMKRLAQRPRKGFTLIELLVVVVIIGILASVALPSFVGAQDKARNSAVQSNVGTVRMALEQYSTDYNGSFPTNLGFTSGTGFYANSYLPGNKMPKSPWCNTDQTVALSTATVVTSVNLTASNVAAGTALPLQSQVGTTNGVVPATGTPPTAANHYGAIEYDLDSNSQTYVVLSTGKKNKQAIVAAGISNGGQ